MNQDKLKRKYFVFNSGLPLPAYRDGEYHIPLLFSMGNKFEYYNDPERWAMNTTAISKEEFDALVIKASDPSYGRHD